MQPSEEQTIRQMDDVLASQVAAGEVVERPSSVIKELVENSIDAGAKAIRIEIRRGGIASMKVTDNGKGMSRTDLSLCLRRHATSKLHSYEDLFDIRQMGFRGEALPSIASVSHLRISTRRKDDVEGSQIVCHGGEEGDICATGCPPGTEIEVRDLFFNTPVRRKFLKSAETEAGHIEHQIKLHALAFPDIRFTFLRDGQSVIDTPATHDHRQRISDFIGRESAGKLLRIRPATGMGVHVEGYLMPLSEASRNKRQQFVFLNGRPIEDKIITRAVRDGYGGFPTGLHPGLFLYLDIEPALVDVNVHPAKREVRFRRPADVTNAIIEAIAGTLADHARGRSSDAKPSPEPRVPELSTPRPAAKPQPSPQPTAEATPPPSHQSAHTDSPTPAPRPLRLIVEPQQQDLALPPTPPATPQETPGVPHFRNLGAIRGQYVLFENAEGLVLLSVRAARERVLFERLIQTHKRPIASQRLLTPALVELDARDIGIAQELQPLFQQAGFHISAFGANTLRIESIPIFLPMSRVDEFITDLIQQFSTGETRLRRARNPFELFAIQMARQYAKQENMNDWLSNPMPLLQDLLHCEIPYCTPRGKPTMIPFPLSEINRRFQAQ